MACETMPPWAMALILIVAFAGIVSFLVLVMALRDRSDFERESNQLRAENDTLRAQLRDGVAGDY